MRKLVFGMWFMLASCLLIGSEVNASWLSEPPLLVLNGQEYSKQEFRNWWKHWNDKGNLNLSNSLNDYIDFNIMAQQALTMELDKDPRYLRKINVFLKVRSLMLLQYEEINSHLKITDQEILQSFNEKFSPVWDLQILTFKDREAAEAAYLTMQPFVGKAAGRLVFADFQGEAGVLYDDVKVSPDDIVKANKKEWFETIRGLKENYFSQPQAVADHEQFILIRLNRIMEPPEGKFEKEKNRVRNNLRKMRQGKMTFALLRKLKKKFNFKVDEKLFNEINLEKEYPQDFLEQTILSIDGMEMPVGLFLSNLKSERIKRPNSGQDAIKKIVRNNIANQLLIDREALERHYELTDYLKGTWAFYTQNRLRISMEEQLMGKIEVSDQEIDEYYGKNKNLYSTPAKVIYLILKGDKDIVQKIWAGQLQDFDLMKSARVHGVEPEKATSSEEDLVGELKKVVSATEKGETSAPFRYQDGEAIVNVQGRIPATKKTLNSVRDEIRKKIIKAKFNSYKISYIKELRERSEVKVDERVWGEITGKNN